MFACGRKYLQYTRMFAGCARNIAFGRASTIPLSVYHSLAISVSPPSYPSLAFRMQLASTASVRFAGLMGRWGASYHISESAREREREREEWQNSVENSSVPAASGAFPMPIAFYSKHFCVPRNCSNQFDAVALQRRILFRKISFTNTLRLLHTICPSCSSKNILT